jgi:hypothetical protein
MIKNELKFKNYFSRLGTISFSLLLLAISIFFIGCDKENLNESVKDDFDKKTYRPEDKTVYFEGIGDIEVKFDKNSKIVNDENFLKMKNFVSEATNINLYIDEENKLNVFKTNQSSLNFIRNKYGLEERCTPIYTNNVTIKFFKHAGYSSEFTGLRRTGEFYIPVVNTSHSGSNDEISSVSIQNERRETPFLVTMYQHINRGGSFVRFGVGRCNGWNVGVGNMQWQWSWWSDFLNSYQDDGPFNDVISSIEGLAI